MGTARWFRAREQRACLQVRFRGFGPLAGALPTADPSTPSFFEHGRMAFMRSLFSEMDDPAGAEQSLMLGKPGNVGMILATTSARYRVRRSLASSGKCGS